MKKSLIFILLALILAFSSCGGAITETSEPKDTKPILCRHQEVDKSLKKAGILEDGYEKTICAACGDILDELNLPATKSLKILAIGNSFSVDATTFLWYILNNAGVEELIVGNAQIGGCSLDKHWTMAQSGDAAYSYTKYTSSGNTTVTCSLMDAVTDEAWDIVTLQQVSNNSGMPETYTHLSDMVDYVLLNCPNVYVDINFHMTWAYQQNSTHGAFVNYEKDQITMYNAIINTVKTVVLENKIISNVLPSGTAIQNLRTSYFGDTLTRDGHHLSLDVGRYTAALTWACEITGISPYKITWVPTEYAHIEEDLPAICEAVENAIANPFEITAATVTVKKELTVEERFLNAGLDINDYELADWEPTLFYHWNSTSRATAGKSDSLPNYIASKKFTKDEIPVGSVIVVDKGYKYRPEGWQESDKVNSAARPSATSVPFTIVDDAWWGDYNYRAFNVSKLTGSAPATEDDTAHFRIYIPKTIGD